MFENPRRGRQARNFTGNDPKIIDLKSSSEQIIFAKIVVGCPWKLDMFGLADRETFSTEYVIADIATGLLLLENRLAYAQSQLISTKLENQGQL